MTNNHRHARLRLGIGSTGLALLLLARATSAEAAGPTPADRFTATARITQMTSQRPVHEVVDCLARTARLPSFAHRTMTADGAVIRLRFDGLMFETLAFTATADGGTAVTVALSGAYDRADRARFMAARGAPLAACLDTPPLHIAAAEQEQGL